ncbi:MAG: sulfatase [Balneolaceae bacterium]|nr:sulfatase [Balneolaceae bacterium]
MKLSNFYWVLPKFFLTFLLAISIPFSIIADNNDKPNVIIFFVDDLGWVDTGVTGSDLYNTPNIDRLAKEGMLFTDAYSSSTICSPTRASLMTGMAPERTRVTDWIDGHWVNQGEAWRAERPLQPPVWTAKLELHHHTIADLLSENGYRTAHIGKWHLTPRSNDPEIVEPYYPHNRGFEVNISGNQWGAPGSYFWDYRRSGLDGLESRVANFPPEKETKGLYLTNMKTNHVVRLIQEWQNEPFFINFSYYQVHTPIQGRPDMVHYYQQILDSGEDFLHTDPEYAAMVEAVDRSVGRVHAKLEELGLDDNTLIIFTSDNGGLDRGDGTPTNNYPLREGKGTAYEGGIRVPMIVRWPGVIPEGTVSEEPVITHDFFPTILEITGAEASSEHFVNLDGVSLMPILENPSVTLDREALYWHYPHYHTQGATPYTAVRAGDWKAIHFYEDDRIELYNLVEDISEVNDLSNEMPEKAEEMRSMIEARRDAVDAQIPITNPLYQDKFEQK